MFYYIKGIYIESGKDFIIVDNNSIGYIVFVSPATISRAPNIGQPIKLYTHYHVREDIIALYGFLTKEELNMFELLISVSGVGPKAGLSVLSVLSPSRLGLSIIGADIKALTTVPGIGNKMAHRIILELKDKIDNDTALGNDMQNIEFKGDITGEAVNALITLGYNINEANTTVRKIDVNGKNIEKIIKEALKILMK